MSTTFTPKRPLPTTAASGSKKPLAPTSSPASTTAANNIQHPTNRSPSRIASTIDGNTISSSTRTTPSTTTSGPAGNMNRTRSVRNSVGPPVSARAAARKQSTTPDPTAEDDAKAELQAKLDELQEKLREAERLCEDSQKHAAVLQVRLDEAVQEQGLLEDHVHEHTERIEELELEKKEHVRARRELEQIYEAERAQMMREKEDSQSKEEELQSTMSRMREALAQKEMRDRTSGLVDEERRRSVSRNPGFRSGNASPSHDAQFAPPSSMQRSDSRSSSRLVMQKDKIIEGLRLELAEAQIKLVELENQGGGRVHELQKEIYDIKMQNARLMEENESFQLLLSEKTLNGDLAHSDLLRPPSRTRADGATLADELEGRDDAESSDLGGEALSRRVQTENNSLKDQNKALTLYINNIISRLLQHEQFEQILDKTPDLIAGPGAALRKAAQAADTEKELPPPPPPKDESVAAPVVEQLQDAASGFLQRARSVIARPKARPTSVYQISQQISPHLDAPEARVNENPDTAPRIPLGRAGSVRGHRRANSEWPAASVTNMMYRGPSPGGLPGPTSPGLSSPRNSFGPGSLGSRVPSTGSANGGVPTITEQHPDFDKENLSSFSSSGHPPNPHRSSVISDPSTSTSLDPADHSTTTTTAATSIAATGSPPHSVTSSSDRGHADSSRPSGAIMMGSRPRPLRLVQENVGGGEEDKARQHRVAGFSGAGGVQSQAAAANPNRGSWFGWMNKAGVHAGVPAVGVSGASGGTAGM